MQETELAEKTAKRLRIVEGLLALKLCVEVWPNRTTVPAGMTEEEVEGWLSTGEEDGQLKWICRVIRRADAEKLPEALGVLLERIEQKLVARLRLVHESFGLELPAATATAEALFQSLRATLIRWCEIWIGRANQALTEAGLDERELVVSEGTTLLELFEGHQALLGAREAVAEAKKLPRRLVLDRCQQKVEECNRLWPGAPLALGCKREDSLAQLYRREGELGNELAARRKSEAERERQQRREAQAAQPAEQLAAPAPPKEESEPAKPRRKKRHVDAA